MFKNYEYIYAVYKEKSFTEAAQKLFISQPSLSAAVKKTENKVGAPLFHRGGGGVVPTQIGEEYIEACKKIISVENDFEKRLNDIYNLETGHITVGGTNYLSSYVLPEIITRFKEHYPKIDVTLEEAKSETLMDMMKHEQLDVIIDSFDDIPGTYSGELLCNERILLCVPDFWEINDELKEFQILPRIIYSGDTKIKDIPSVPVDIFKDFDFVLLKNGNDMYNRAMKIFSDSNITPNVSFSVDQLNISYALTESGIGASFVTDTLCRYRKFHKNVFLYNVDENNCNRALYIVHNKNKYCSSAMKKFIEIAKKSINNTEL